MGRIAHGAAAARISAAAQSERSGLLVTTKRGLNGPPPFLDQGRSSSNHSPKAGATFKNKTLPKAGAAKKIPVTNYISTGKLAKLVTNIFPELGLYNSARGLRKPRVRSG